VLARIRRLLVAHAVGSRHHRLAVRRPALTRLEEALGLLRLLGAGALAHRAAVLLKRCAHLSIHQVDSAGSAVFYRIVCAKDSFEVVPPVEFMGAGIHDRHRCYIISAG
jgi:hypothetical protein